MIREDDRTKEQKKSHDWLIVGTDPGMSGWGGAAGGMSYAAWDCTGMDRHTVEAWVRNRSDMRRVRVVRGGYYPKGCAHLHIYVVDANKGHAALGSF